MVRKGPRNTNSRLNDVRPNLIVVGVGHSGTTIFTKMMTHLGWNAHGCDRDYLEHKEIREVNRQILAHDTIDQARATAALRELDHHRPWIIKDPRFSATLFAWLEHLYALDPQPMLVHLTRNLQDVKDSYVRRGEIIRGKAGNKWKCSDRGFTVEEQLSMLAVQLKDCKLPILTISYEEIAAAASLFKLRQPAKDAAGTTAR